MDAAKREILANNLKRVRERIAAACARVKRDPKEVTLIAVTKSVGPDVMQALIELGVTDIGENKLQAAKEKFPHVPALRDRTKVKRHFIGHLQTNKVKGVLELFDVIHSVDSVKLAQEIDKRAKQLGLSHVPCFVELNSGEEQKGGFRYQGTADSLPAWDAISDLRNIRLIGLMTMAPLGQDSEQARPCFARLKSECLTLDLCRPHDPAAFSLSMGMSNDFEIAIEEGATHVRIGTALFEGL